MKLVTSWVESIYEIPAFLKIFGKIQLSSKALKGNFVDEKKAAVKKEAAPAAAPKKKEEKVKVHIKAIMRPKSSCALVRCLKTT